jgi:hypothetical protein
MQHRSMQDASPLWSSASENFDMHFRKHISLICNQSVVNAMLSTTIGQAFKDKTTTYPVIHVLMQTRINRQYTQVKKSVVLSRLHEHHA